MYGYFAAWRDDGTLARLHDALRAQVRAAAGRDAEPTAAIIDSQSVRAADTVPKATRGWDNAKKVNGRKRHIAVDAMGLLLAVVITAASVQDRDAARPLLQNLHRTSRRIRLIWADSVYNGKLNAWAAAMKMTLQVVARRQPHALWRCSRLLAPFYVQNIRKERISVPSRRDLADNRPTLFDARRHQMVSRKRAFFRKILSDGDLANALATRGRFRPSQPLIALYSWKREKPG